MADETALLDKIKKIVAIPSTADNPAALHQALELIAERLEATPGICIERFEQNGKPSLLAYAGKERPKTFGILLNGHVDVVPAKTGQFEPRVEDGRLYGRGTLDMKASALVLTEVFCELAAKVKLPLGLQIVSDEEIGGQNGTLHQMEQGVKANFVICGEFTPRAAICNASRGICQVKVTLSGTAAHSAYPWDGKNAVLLANDYVTKLLEKYPLPKAQSWVTTANISSINTESSAINRVPDVAAVEIDIRYVPEDQNFKSKQAAEKFLQSLDPQSRVQILMYEPAHYADPNHKLSALLAESVGQATNQPAKFIQKSGAADVRYYSKAGSTAVVLGLQGEGLHGDNEWLDVASLGEYYKILKDFLLSI